MADATGKKFRAFLSYSRADSAAVAKLHRRLERYEIPKALRKDGKRTLGRFFRDKEELSAAAEVGTELYAKLDQAEQVILCCSPDAAASHWVNAEVQHTLESKGQAGLMAAILRGKPEEVFPPALKGREPLAADFRKEGDGEEIGFLKLVAGLLDVDLGELRDRQAAAERARVRLRTALVVVFALLTVVATGAAVAAVQQQKRAEAMALEAVDIGAGVVDKASDLSRTYGVPTGAIETLLTFAEERYERLFAAGVRNDELLRRRALLLLSFAEISERGGDVAAQRRYSEAAIKQFADLLTRGIAPPAGYTQALMLAGRASVAQGDDKAGFTHLEAAAKIARAAFSDDPKSAAARNLLGKALFELGQAHMRGLDAKSARPLLAEAADLMEESRKEAPKDDLANTNLIAALDLLAGAQALQNEYDTAEATIQRSVALGRLWIAGQPDSLPARATLASSLTKLAQMRNDREDMVGADATFAEAIAITRDLIANDPDNAELQAELALRISLAANVKTALAMNAEAAALRREGLDAARAVIARDPTNLTFKDTYAKMLQAAYFGEHAEPRQALAHARALVALRREMMKPLGETPAARADLATALELLGDASASNRNLQGMLAAYGEAEPIRRALAAAAPDNVEARAAHASTLHALGLSRKFAGDLEGARKALTQAARLRRQASEARPEDLALAFAAVDSLQQLALVESNFDGAATKASFEAARTILRRLVRAAPRDARYADSLAKTEDVLAMLNAPTTTPAVEQ